MLLTIFLAIEEHAGTGARGDGSRALGDGSRALGDGSLEHAGTVLCVDAAARHCRWNGGKEGPRTMPAQGVSLRQASRDRGHQLRYRAENSKGR